MNTKQTARLNRKEVPAYRKKLLARQGGLCGLCGLPVKKGQDTLDHDHDTGHCRAVLCRNCNQIEGRIKAWAKRAYCDPVDFLQALIDHWTRDYTHYAIHPNHLFEVEKDIRKLKKRMRNLRTERAKQRYRDRIEELKELL